jgi:hypothetical protein
LQEGTPSALAFEQLAKNVAQQVAIKNAASATVVA